MDNPFSQSKLIYTIHFNTLHKHLEVFERFFSENILGVSTFEIESKTIEADDADIWCFEAYFAKKPQKMVLVKNIQKFSNENNLEIIGNIDFKTIKDQDWVSEYQKQLVPICIGRFFISTLKQLDQCPPSSLPIILEASRAFGTGDHPTTAGCLEILEKLSEFDFKTIYDIGTGSGILSFAAEKTWPKAKIWACDIEENSIEVAKINQQFNNSKINFYQNSSGENLQNPNFQNKKFDLIVSNILSQPLIKLAPSICFLLKRSGKLILSGFLDYQMHEIINIYKESNLEVEKITNKSNWITLLLKIKNN
ncbi:MAG: 50S ribosomal protein L11 methyltransferase [Rickettsiaceae bacterium]